jgi:multiple sugar transport system substrate-binding protein
MTPERTTNGLSRRTFVGLGLGAAGVAAGVALGSSRSTSLAAGLLQQTPAAPDASSAVDSKSWNPDTIRKLAGTLEVNTAEEAGKIVPLDHKGKVSYWYVGPNQASPDLDKKIDAEFWAAFQQTYPNIEVDRQNLDYNQMLDKVRTAALGGAAPCVAKMPILWGVEFAAKGQLEPIELQEFGYSSDQFWEGALKSVTWADKRYGIPTNNETMALIWNRDIFAAAGLDPEKPPATWADLVAYSKQIKANTGKAGYGLVARANAGNTPFRFMPVVWAHGGGALDEAEPHPTYDKVLIDSEGTQAALQTYYDMYVRDQSVPTSALTNTQTENQDPFIAGQLAMVISHPSEYAAMIDRAAKATGSDKAIAQKVVDSMAYGLIPEGPARRAVVFGGSNVHMFAKDVVGGDCDREAAKALMTFMTLPEWSTKIAWTGSNPGNLRGFETKWMKERLEQIKFLDVTTSMLPYGIPFPVVPESTEIMNIIVPEMIQNALTKQMSVEEATSDAADKVKEALG